MMNEDARYADRPARIAVIDYGMGNLRSVCKALEREGAEAGIVTDPEAMKAFDGVVFPGQGALGDCVASMRENGMDEALRRWIAAGRPYLGVCLGLQALFEHSEEGDTPGLGVFAGRVKRFRLPAELKIPHMGWNEARLLQEDSPLFAGMDAEAGSFYFVHSYYVEPADRSLVLCETDYGHPFVSGVARGHCFAVQFHPEKSQSRGLTLYRNFISVVGWKTRLPG